MSVNRDMLDDVLAEGYDVEEFLYALVDVIPENVLERYLEKAASYFDAGEDGLDYLDEDDEEDDEDFDGDEEEEDF